MSAAYEDEKRCYQGKYLSESVGGRVGRQEEIRTTPLFSLAVKHVVDPVQQDTSSAADDSSNGSSSSSEAQSSAKGGSSNDSSSSCSAASASSFEAQSSAASQPILPQYALLGFHVGDSASISSGEPIMLNVNAPNSVFICGSQGSGKSYTLSAMIENCLLKDSTIGSLSNPVAGVVFHYDIDSSASVAEVAHLCSRGIKVDVLVSQSNERALRQAYEGIGSDGNRPHVRPLLLRSSDLTIDSMNKLMALAEKEGSPPLYMEIIQRILRQMAVTSATFNYKHFRAQLAQETLSKDQLSPMNLRFSLLESFLHPNDVPSTAPPTTTRRRHPLRSQLFHPSQQNLFQLHPGTLTIIDLSDPFLDASTACLLFSICLRLIKSQRPPAGLVLALDEAHKFMSGASSGAEQFTRDVMTTIREQRHNATRVVIATQEPTIRPELLDLCGVAVVHRFSSPSWFAAVRGHLGGGRLESGGGGGVDGEGGEGLFERIVELDVGESLVFAPMGFVKVSGKDGEEVQKNLVPDKLGTGVMKMKTRRRMGTDGGMSVLASG